MDGGYSEFAVVGEEWAYLLPDGINFVDAAPLLCGGIVGYRALKALDRGGILVLGGIYMSPIPEMDYSTFLWDEHVIRSVANATREDGEELLRYAAEIPVTTNTVTFPLEEVNEALLKMKRSELTGDAVIIP